MAAAGPVTAGAAAAGEGSIDPRLRPAAHEFEACLMKEFLEPLQHDALFDDGTGENSSEGSDNALMSFGSEALAKAISERGGFGIAASIIGHFEKKGYASERPVESSESFLRMGRKR